MEWESETHAGRFRISASILWSAALLGGGITLALARRGIVSQLKERTIRRNSSGPPVCLWNADISLAPEQLSGVLSAPVGGLLDACASAQWRDFFVGAATWASTVVRRRLYWIDYVGDNNSRESHVDPREAFAGSEAWRAWVGQDYVLVLYSEGGGLFNMKGLDDYISRTRDDGPNGGVSGHVAPILGRYAVAKFSVQLPIFKR